MTKSNSVCYFLGNAQRFSIIIIIRSHICHIPILNLKEQEALSNLFSIPNEMCQVVRPQITLQFPSMHFFSAQPVFLEGFLLCS